MKLSTLEGEEMPNWISGCRIKKYHKPLTQNELNLLHQAKWQKERKKIEIELAQEEAKLRVQKRKLVRETGKPMWIYKMELLRGEEELDEEIPQPIITIQVGEERLVTQAFIDSGADGNTISYEFYKQLKGVEIHKTTTTFKSSTGHKTKPHGVCMLPIFVDELTCGNKFFVTQAGL